MFSGTDRLNRVHSPIAPNIRQATRERGSPSCSTKDSQLWADWDTPGLLSHSPVGCAGYRQNALCTMSRLIVDCRVTAAYRHAVSYCAVTDGRSNRRGVLSVATQPTSPASSTPRSPVSCSTLRHAFSARQATDRPASPLHLVLVLSQRIKHPDTHPLLMSRLNTAPSACLYRSLTRRAVRAINSA